MYAESGFGHGTLQEVERMFADALAAFPASARLHWFVSQYVRAFKKNRHIEQLHLMAAEVCCFCRYECCASYCPVSGLVYATGIALLLPAVFR
jgi:hypothetical protein